ncbi:MAG: citrate/2-methylcitrate synthase [Vampirovibrionales bacterium]
MLAIELSTAQDAALASYKPGLEGVVAGKTTVGSVDPKGITLLYRGYDVQTLVNQQASYEEVAYLLIYGTLPTATELSVFEEELKYHRSISNAMMDMLEHLPSHVHLMDQLKATVAMLSVLDVASKSYDSRLEENQSEALRLVAKVPTIVAAITRRKMGLPIMKPSKDKGHAANFLYMLTGEEPSQAAVRAMNAVLIVYAEHGFNASTFTARVAASTLSDMNSSITAAIGALKGPLHGGANEAAMKMLLEIGDVEQAEHWMRRAIAEKRLIMGFGHRQYKHGDPRARILQELAVDVAQHVKNMKWIEMSEVCAKVMKEEKNLHPNVDFPIAYIFYMLGLPIECYTPIFAVGRMAGWTAHVIEQHQNNRLIRPDAIYEGAVDVPFVPVAQRG